MKKHHVATIHEVIEEAGGYADNHHDRDGRVDLISIWQYGQLRGMMSLGLGGFTVWRPNCPMVRAGTVIDVVALVLPPYGKPRSPLIDR